MSYLIFRVLTEIKNVAKFIFVWHRKNVPFNLTSYQNENHSQCNKKTSFAAASVECLVKFAKNYKTWNLTKEKIIRQGASSFPIDYICQSKLKRKKNGLQPIVVDEIMQWML